MQRLPILLALISAALFGAAIPASKLLLEGLTPFQLAGLLYIGSALAVAPTALRQGGFALPRRAGARNRYRLLGAVLFGGVLGPLFLLYGLRVAEATSVSLWLNLELAATAVLGVALFRDHLSPIGWTGVGAAFVGSVILAWGTSVVEFMPAALVLLACICWGLDNHLTALIDGITPSQSTLWKGIVAGAVNFGIGIVLAPVSASLTVLALALLVGALSYGASIALYIRAAQAIGATRAQVIFATAPLFGVVLSVVMLGESFTIVHAVAASVLVAGVGLLMLERHSHSHHHHAMKHKHSHRHDDGHHNHVHPGLPPGTRHTHWHEHASMNHSHPHWPDLHHRHKHYASRG